MENQSRRLAVAIAAAAGLLVIAALLLTWAVRQGKRQVETLVEKKEETVDVTALVTQIRSLSRLETASMRVVHVATTTQSYGKVPQQLSGDELTFMGVGDVIAGVDLSHLTEQQVVVQGKEVIITLPPPEILLSRVDNRQSKVMNRETGFLRRADPDLESRARQHAEIGIRQEAMKRGILALAGKNAQERLAHLAKLFGAEKVTFVNAAPREPEGRGGIQPAR